MLHVLKNRVAFGVVAGFLALALSPILTLSTAHADPDARPALDMGPVPASPGLDAPAAYARATEPSTAEPLAGAKTSAKAKQAARKGGKDAGQPFIEFRSRHAMSYGHTFVVFGRLNARGEVGEIKPDMVAGLHPAGAGSELWTIGHAVFVPAETGYSDGDLEEEYVSNRARVVLTEEQYAKLVAHIRRKQASSPVWHAALYNCNLWTGEIAAHLGLKTGFHWLKPADYIEKIKELNGIGPDGVRVAWQG